ncbi:MAG: 50S ribosomal protein L30 [Chthonomonadaceae bacterium]|nr:50S ribosomal protein L30 [Chthonomonadaceae bacterium]
MPAKIKITYKKSAIGYAQSQKDTIRNLGFKKLSQVVVRDDSPILRGMIHKVKHLVFVELIEE